MCSRGYQRAGLVQQGCGKDREPFPSLCSFVHSFRFSAMPGVWLRPESGGDWRWFPTIASAIAHLKDKGTAIWPTQVSHAAQQGTTRNGWCVRSTDLNATDAEDEVPPTPSADNPQPHGATVLGFFTPTSVLPSCGCCGEKLLGDILLCSRCNQHIHALCLHQAKCFICVCRICDCPPGDVMCPCKVCKHQVHGLMWCLTCKAYPQPGMHKAWHTGTHTLRRRGVLEHSNSGLRAVALAPWESDSTSSTLIGGLPELVRIFGLFMLVYRIVKRMASFENLFGDVVQWHRRIEHDGKLCPSCMPSLHPSGQPRGVSRRMPPPPSCVSCVSNFLSVYFFSSTFNTSWIMHHKWTLGLCPTH